MFYVMFDLFSGGRLLTAFAEGELSGQG